MTTKQQRQGARDTGFTWAKDAAGYDLSQDRKAIVRRGGPLTPYRVEDVDPPIHRTAAYWFHPLLMTDETLQEAGASAKLGLTPMRTGVGSGADTDAAEATLQFIREFGFLGLTAGKSDATSEPIDYVNSTMRSFALLATQPSRLWVSGFNEHAPLMRASIVSDANGQSRLHFQPDTLAGWIWYRLANEFVEGVNWTGPACLYCGKALPRGPGAFRSDAEFDSSKCKTYFYRLPAADQAARRKAAAKIKRKGSKP